MQGVDRRQFLKIAGLGGVVFASGLARGADGYGAAQDEFFFVQLSDTHWGFQGAPNPDAAGTLPKAIAAVNALDPQPDFIVFTGDLTHTTDDPAERRRRLTQFKEHIGKLRTRQIRLDYVAGQSVAALVYKRREHVIDVFVSPGAHDAAPSAYTRDGFNVTRLARGGMRYWIVSDLNRNELDDFARLLAR
jgi:3',5'-cyclic AMP phosphodiesterase CpdA